MREFSVWYEFGAWSVKSKENSQVYSTPPMPSLEDALRYAADQTGGPVGIKLVTRDG
jgi:hypothetical protein